MLDQCSRADGLHILMQPSGQSDSEWRDVPCLDLCVRKEDGKVGEHKRYDERKQKVRAGAK